ncbi:RING finger protein 223-like [Pleurodeles waltl]|uniref:RING finger protein 223-like n=1 Tax=Pleurodeles waltl TaxID=8319 RepID=UPI003709BC9F
MELERAGPECPVCFSAYDNVFKAPLILPCAHTFCLECLARICIFKKESEVFSCPLCRGPVPIPQGGVPKLPANQTVLAQFLPWKQCPQEVWVEGSKLCCKKTTSMEFMPTGTTQGQEDDGMVVTINLLWSAAHPAPSPGDLVSVPRQGHLSRCSLLCRNWAYVIWIASFCLILLFIIVFFPSYVSS